MLAKVATRSPSLIRVSGLTTANTELASKSTLKSASTTATGKTVSATAKAS